MKSIWNLIGRNIVHVSDIFNWYSASISGMLNVQKLDGNTK